MSLPNPLSWSLQENIFNPFLILSSFTLLIHFYWPHFLLMKWPSQLSGREIVLWLRQGSAWYLTSCIPQRRHTRKVGCSLSGFLLPFLQPGGIPRRRNVRVIDPSFRSLISLLLTISNNFNRLIHLLCDINFCFPSLQKLTMSIEHCRLNKLSQFHGLNRGHFLETGWFQALIHISIAS